MFGCTERWPQLPMKANRASILAFLAEQRKGFSFSTGGDAGVGAKIISREKWRDAVYVWPSSQLVLVWHSRLPS